MAERPARQMCLEWREHPVTKYLVKDLEEQVQDLQDAWGRGAFTREHTSGTVQINAQSIGAVKALQETVLDIRDIGGDDEDNS
jgi:uncharacterized protein YukE